MTTGQVLQGHRDTDARLSEVFRASVQDRFTADQGRQMVVAASSIVAIGFQEALTEGVAFFAVVSRFSC